jgi:hypothetical protein
VEEARAAAYLLENENDVTDSHVPIEQITGVDPVRALVDYASHFKFILDIRRFGHHLAPCARLASNILIYRLRRSPSNAREKLGSLICTHLEGALGRKPFRIRALPSISGFIEVSGKTAVATSRRAAKSCACLFSMGL